MNAIVEQEAPVVADGSLSEGEIPFIIFPNLTGDVTITWDQSNEEYVRQMVADKMKEGYVFFILKPRKIFGKTIVNTKTKVKKVEDLQNAVMDEKGERSVVLRTDDNNIKFTGVPQGDNRQVGVKQDGLGIAFDAKDKDLNLAIENDKIQLVKPDSQQEKQAVRRARTPEEVVKKQSMGTRPIAGG